MRAYPEASRRVNALPMTLAEGLWEVPGGRYCDRCGLVVVSQRTGQEVHRNHVAPPKREDDDYVDNYVPHVSMPTGG